MLNSITSRDRENYYILLEQSDQPQKKDKRKDFAFQQQRKGVTKQALFLYPACGISPTQGIKDQHRLQWRLNSESSELKFKEQEGFVELVEYFNHVSCTIQQKAAQDFHVLQFLSAQDAVYYYKSERLIAENAFVARYLLPDEKWNEHFLSFLPFMKGKAKRMEILFSKKAPVFKAQGWEAKIQEKGISF